MTDARALAKKVREARKACHCLFAQLPEEVARDVTDKVDAALTGYLETIDQAKRETWEEAAKIVERDAPQFGGRGYPVRRQLEELAKEIRQQAHDRPGGRDE